jgi:hypothetical protein
LINASELSRPTVNGNTAPGNKTVSRTGKIGSWFGIAICLSAIQFLSSKTAPTPRSPPVKSLDAGAPKKIPQLQ